MYRSFRSFREDRDILEFGRNYDNLCSAIVESGMSFDYFWEHHGLPYFLKGGASNSDELLEGLSPASWNWQGLGQGIQSGAQAVGNFFNPQQPGQAAAPGQPGQPGQQPPPLPGQTPPGAPNAAQPGTPQTPADSAALSADATKKTAAAMDTIKSSFSKAMQSLITQYQSSRDSVGYQLATDFLNKVNGYADKLKIQRGQGKFDMNTGFGQPAAGATAAPRPGGTPAMA